MKVVQGVLFFFLGLIVYGQEIIVPKQRILIDPSQSGKTVELYLLVGQSNMAGNSPVQAQDTVPNPRIIRLNKNKQWEIAKDPLRVDKDIIGMGPGMAFAREMVKRDTTIIIGLIPAAVGGTSIDLWKPKAYDSITKLHPYDQAIKRAEFAQKIGKLRAVLWNQGESDSRSGKSKNYKYKLKRLVTELRKDLINPDLLFIAGFLPEYQIHPSKNSVNKDAMAINKAILELKYELPNYQVIKVKGTKDKGDGVHYDSESVRKLGKAYAKKVIKLH